MFAQANSEHCRHKIFNASLDHRRRRRRDNRLFAMIRNTYQANNENVLSAYRDNAAVIRGGPGARFFPDPATNIYTAHEKRSTSS